MSSLTAIRASQLAAQDVPIPAYVNAHLKSVIAECITADEFSELFEALQRQQRHELPAVVHDSID